MSEYRRLCARCHQPIGPGEKVVPFTACGESGAGATLELHDRCPGPVPPYQRMPADTSGHGIDQA